MSDEYNTNKKSDVKRRFFFCAPERSWTVTTVAGHRILSPACLPIPPPGSNKAKKIPHESGTMGEDQAELATRPWQGRALPMSYFRF